MGHATPESRLEAAGFRLPGAPKPKGTYAPYCTARIGESQFISVSGQTCRVDGVAWAGICTRETGLDVPRDAARIAILNSLAALRDACGGNLQAVAQVTRLRGFVRSTDDFGSHTAVLDAASELLRIAFPDHRLPARSAIGVNSLPDGAWVEIELDAVVR
ncbi:RidA family protein [Paraburkholderia sp. BCC1885]|uniref:RidA family protein n=1 Tax=Paraburkholderia sp. BCC1885 TaxID=2562669 RepID=UPI001183846E|nr:RidA family protein [Paraburkholderia sp. BCC1885]